MPAADDRRRRRNLARDAALDCRWTVSTHDRPMSRFHAQSVGGLDATYMSYRPSPPAHGARTRVDVSLLQLSDRACLRLLEHSRVCTASQLSNLIYPSLRTALSTNPQALAQSNLAHSRIPSCRSRRNPPRLSTQLIRTPPYPPQRHTDRPASMTTRHSLDGVEFPSPLSSPRSGACPALVARVLAFRTSTGASPA